jgi:hypothetical protein
MIVSDDEGSDTLQKSLRSGTGNTARPAETAYDPPSHDGVMVSNTPASPTSPLVSPMSPDSHHNYQAIPPSTSHFPQGSEVDSAKRAHRRFISSLALALIIYITLAAFLSVHYESHVEASDVHRLYKVARLIFSTDS